MYAALLTLYVLCVRNTSFAPKTNFVHVYDLRDLSSLCIRIYLFALSGLFPTYMVYALEATYAYEYGFARNSTYSSTSFLTLQRGDDSRENDR